MKTLLWITINAILFVSVFSVPVSRSKRDASEENAVPATEANLEERNEPPATEVAELNPKEDEVAQPTVAPREERDSDATEQNAELVNARNDVTSKSEDLITGRNDEIATSAPDLEGKGDELTPKSAALTLEVTLEPKEAEKEESSEEPGIDARNEPTVEGRLAESDATEKSERKRREANELTERSVDEDELTPKSTDEDLTPRSAEDELTPKAVEEEELTPKSVDENLTPRAEFEASTFAAN